MKTMSLLNHLLKKVLLMFIFINSIMNCFVWTEIASELKQASTETLPVAPKEPLSSPLKTLSTNNLILEKNNSQETIKHQLGEGKGTAAIVEPLPPPTPPNSSPATISNDNLKVNDKGPLVDVNDSPTTIQQHQHHQSQKEQQQLPPQQKQNQLNEPTKEPQQLQQAANLNENSTLKINSVADDIKTDANKNEITVNSTSGASQINKAENQTISNSEANKNQTIKSENVDKVDSNLTPENSIVHSKTETKSEEEPKVVATTPVESLVELVVEPEESINVVADSLEAKENKKVEEINSLSSVQPKSLSEQSTSTQESSTIESVTQKVSEIKPDNESNELRLAENIELNEKMVSISTEIPKIENKTESEKTVDENEEIMKLVEKENSLDTKEKQEVEIEQTTNANTVADSFQTSTESIKVNSNTEAIIKDFIENVETTSPSVENVIDAPQSNEESQQILSSSTDIANNSNEKKEKNEALDSVTMTIQEDIVSKQEQPSSSFVDTSDQLNENLSVHENELRRERNEANIKVISHTIHNSNHATKYCTDVKPIRDLFTDHIEPIYYPILNMLPEDIQLVLMDETAFGGLSLASCSLISLTLFITCSFLFFMLKKCDSGNSKLTHNLNEKLMALNNEIKTLKAERETFEAVFCDMESKLHHAESKFGDSDVKISELIERNEKLTRENEMNLKELEKLRANEVKLNKECNSAKFELNELTERYLNQKNEFDTILARQQDEFSQKLNELTGKLIENETQIQLFQSSESEKLTRINELETSEALLREQLESKEKTVIMLQNSLLKEKKPQTPTRNTPSQIQSDWNNDDFVDLNDEIQNENNLANNNEKLNDIMKTAQLEMEMTTLVNTLNETKQLYEQKQVECDSLAQKLIENQEFIKSFETRRKELERSLREHEVQIKLLNELREKDTKQHVKALSDLDAQLKRKSTDADKVQHLLDQLRVKQERIQDLESQMTRVEKQATQERQTFEKQAHENWLNARKFEKELKDSRNEINALRERLNEMEHMNKSMSKYFQMGPNKMMNYSVNESYNKDNVENELSANADNNNDAQTSSDNSGNEQQRPPSTSSNSGMNYMPANLSTSYGYIRPPPPSVYTRFPYPLSYMQQAHQMQTAEQRAAASSPTPDLVNGTQTSNAVRMPLSSPYSPYQQASMGGVPPPAMFRMHPLMLQQQYMHQQHLKSASSSQQPSPGTFYNSTMNESSYNSNNVNNNSSMVNSPPRENSNEFELNESISINNNNPNNNPIETSANLSV